MLYRISSECVEWVNVNHICLYVTSYDPHTLETSPCCRSVVHPLIIVICGHFSSNVSNVANIVNRVATHHCQCMHSAFICYMIPLSMKEQTRTNQYYLSPFLRVYYITYSIIYIYLYKDIRVFVILFVLRLNE